MVVCISNHQSYLDWIYTWVLFYYFNHHGSLVIILKSTLKWGQYSPSPSLLSLQSLTSARTVPVVGPAMQIFNFIFLKAKGWELDSTPTGIQLDGLAKRAMKTTDEERKKLSLLVYPEGTLVSKLTRPGSLRFAERKGIVRISPSPSRTCKLIRCERQQPDLQNLLLPRSTGTLFSLRALASKIPDCGFYDLTIGYPGVPPHGYAQSYYTIASVFARSQPPPSVHIHIRRIPLDDIPFAAHSLSPTLKAKELDAALSIEEREVFDEWLRKLWTSKDALLESFALNGEFKTSSIEGGKNAKRLEIPISVRGVDDYLLIGLNFLPIYLAYKGVYYAYVYYGWKHWLGA